MISEAKIIERIQESRDIFTLRLAFTDPEVHRNYCFAPGQFNMLYMFGLGEVPISIVSDPKRGDLFDHTIRSVGRITRAMATLKPGDRIGVRGPYGRGWPLRESEGSNILLLTGGLGCAPSVSVIHYVLNRRRKFGKLTILQGVKKSAELIWRKQYEKWAGLPQVEVLLAADVAQKGWPGIEGPVTQLLDEAKINASNTVAMLCGPEPMMAASARELVHRGVSDADIWLSMERNMQCAVGQCGHCQYGKYFVCREGPVFPYPDISELMQVKGY